MEIKHLSARTPQLGTVAQAGVRYRHRTLGGMPSILVTVILVAQVPSASYELTAVTIISPGYACSGQWRSRALRWALTDELARQDAPDWPARGDVGAPDRWDRRSVAEVFRGAVHLAEVDAVVADLCADVHLGDLHEVQGGEVHRPVVVVMNYLSTKRVKSMWSIPLPTPCDHNHRNGRSQCAEWAITIRRKP